MNVRVLLYCDDKKALLYLFNLKHPCYSAMFLTLPWFPKWGHNFKTEWHLGVKRREELDADLESAADGERAS